MSPQAAAASLSFSTSLTTSRPASIPTSRPTSLPLFPFARLELVAVFVITVGSLAGCFEPTDTAIDDEERAASVAPDERRLCAWNIRRLGHRYDHREKDIEATANVIEDNCDFVAVTEVMRKAGGHPGFDDLIDELGPEWDAAITDHPVPENTSTPEFYAFYYRADLFEPCPGWEAPRFISDPNDVFDREPGYQCFATEHNGFAFDFVAGAYHARWAGGKLSERKAEVKMIAGDIDGDGDADDVFEELSDAAPDENDIFLFGDFNLVPKDIASVLPGYIDATDGFGSTLRSNDTRSQNLYDHLIMIDRSATPELVGNAEVLDVRDYKPSNDTFARAISDHLPIRATIRLIQPDDDGCEPNCGEPPPTGDQTPSESGELVITEMHINPKVLADSAGEWVEIQNTSDRTLDLDGCTIGDADIDMHVLDSSNGNLVVGPGEFLVLARTSSPGFTPDAVLSGFQLANSGDEVILGCAAVVIDEVFYGSGWAVTSGKSLSLSADQLSDSANDDPENWCAATENFNGDFGTPGSLNSSCLSLGLKL